MATATAATARHSGTAARGGGRGWLGVLAVVAVAEGARGPRGAGWASQHVRGESAACVLCSMQPRRDATEPAALRGVWRGTALARRPQRTEAPAERSPATRATPALSHSTARRAAAELARSRRGSPCPPCRPWCVGAPRGAPRGRRHGRPPTCMQHSCVCAVQPVKTVPAPSPAPAKNR